MPSRPMLGDDERADARDRSNRAARSTQVEPGRVGPAVDRDVAAARVEADRDLAGMQRRAARRRAPGARPRRCRSRRACTPAANRSPASSTDAHAAAGLHLARRPLAQIASIDARGSRSPPSRAASRSTTWIQRAPARVEAGARPRPGRRRRRVSRVVVALLQAHDLPAAQVDRRDRGPSRVRRLATASTKFAEHAQPDVAALLGVELRGPHGPALDRGREPAAVVAPRGDDARRRRARARTSARSSSHAGSGRPATSREPGRALERVPPHLRELHRRRASGVTRPATHAEAGDAGRLVAAVEQHLHADADAEERAAVGGGRRASTASRPRPRSAAMHAPKAPTPGSTTASAACDRRRASAVSARVGAEVLRAPSRPSAGCRSRSRRPRSVSVSSEQRALGRRHVVALDLHRVAQRAGDALERRLDHVVAVLAA